MYSNINYCLTFIIFSKKRQIDKNTQNNSYKKSLKFITNMYKDLKCINLQMLKSHALIPVYQK